MNISKNFNPISFIGILLLMAFVGSCSDKLVGVDGYCPIVESTSPVNLATDVEGNTVITVTFTDKIDPATMNSAAFVLTTPDTEAGPGSQAKEITGVMTYDNNSNTMSFTPGAPLVSGIVYTGRMKNTVEDPMGNRMLEDYVWSFTIVVTQEVPTNPTVLSTDPGNGDSDVAINKVISVTFSEEMDPSTINTTTITLKQGASSISGTVSYSGVTATFTPESNLEAGTQYTIGVSGGAQNLAGDGIEEFDGANFTTGEQEENGDENGDEEDTTNPAVISTDPIDGDTDVALDKVISVTFSEEMDPSTINTTTITLNQGTSSISGTVSYSGVTATFTPGSDLESGTQYTIGVTGEAQDLAGNGIDEFNGADFTTEEEAEDEDTTNPTVLSTDPSNGDTDVALNKVVSVTFSEEMNPSTISTTTITLNQGTSSISGSVSYSGVTATFTPDSDLEPGTQYTIGVTDGAQDLAGNGIDEFNGADFTTEEEEVTHATVNLGNASRFGAFGGNAGITNEGLNTVIDGSIGTTAASTLITGFHDELTGDVYTETTLNVGAVEDGIFTAPPAPGTETSQKIAEDALEDATAARNSISPGTLPGGIDLGTDELGGLTLEPGVYKSASGTYAISNVDLTLDAQGDENAVWIFQAESSLTVGTPTGARSITLTNGALAKNVFWYVGSAATINGAGGGIMVGTILSDSGVTFSTAGNVEQTVLNGRAISLTASVTMVNTTINVPN